jgi:hypothetical protein
MMKFDGEDWNDRPPLSEVCSQLPPTLTGPIFTTMLIPCDRYGDPLLGVLYEPRLTSKSNPMVCVSSALNAAYSPCCAVTETAGAGPRVAQPFVFFGLGFPCGGLGLRQATPGRHGIPSRAPESPAALLLLPCRAVLPADGPKPQPACQVRYRALPPELKAPLTVSPALRIPGPSYSEVRKRVHKARPRTILRGISSSGASKEVRAKSRWMLYPGIGFP